LIQRTQSQRLVGHILRDSTAIVAREKPAPKAEPAAPIRRRHRKSGTTQNPEQMSRVERQCSGKMSLEEMLAELPRACNIGCKPNSKGKKQFWTGYKLHLDVADGHIPISCLLTSASLNDNQAAVPLAMLTAQRVTSCYDLMDAGYDCEAIREHSRKLGHVPIINRQKHGSVEPLMDPHEKARYRERTTVERVYARLKEEFGGSTVRVRGAVKVMAHLMFGILALTADQILRWCGARSLEDSTAPA
jgi:IS5 family transposase